MIYDDEPIRVTCNGCQAYEEVETWSEAKHHPWHRTDAYGMSTGVWCDNCRSGPNKKYPYREDRYYDPTYAGERMDDDY
jgi:hypothetical protein